MDKNLPFPILDLSVLEPSSGDYATLEKAVSKQIIAETYTALSTYGFLYITGHGINEELIKKSFKVAKKFFTSCKEIHKRYRRKEGVLLGYVDGINEKFFKDRPEDLKQAYDFVIKCNEFQAIPDDVKNTLEELFQKLNIVSKFLLRLLALCFAKDTTYLTKGHQNVGNIETNSSTMSIRHYPAINDKPAPNQSRMSEHTDFGTFTMLLQDDVGGLEVLSKDGVYQSAVPIKNSIILNIGDLLELWTDKKLKATLHRVSAERMYQEKCARQSIVFFTNPDNCYEIEHCDKNGSITKKSVYQHMEDRRYQSYNNSVK